ncbi:MAG: hypothetical protein ACSNEK_03460 [Parachlamydiaceae bacterium]
MKVFQSVANFTKEIATGVDVQAAKSKKKGALFAIAASVIAVAVVALAAFTVISTSLGITSMLTGAGLLIGGFQVANAAANAFLVTAAAYLLYNSIRSAHHHLHNKTTQIPTNTLLFENQSPAVAARQST